MPKLKINKIQFMDTVTNINFYDKQFHEYKQKVLYSFFVLLIICHFYLVGSPNIQDVLKTMPKNEKEDLERLFQRFFRGDFGYTLFGDKPMSLEPYYTTSFDNFTSFW
jgi:hypothetical protein